MVTMSGRGSIEQTDIHRMLYEYFDIPVEQDFGPHDDMSSQASATLEDSPPKE
jgi:hypothetical protein